MITVRTPVTGPGLPAGSPDTLYFDIETTGLSSRSSQLYLIGVCRQEDDGFFVTQWMAEDLADERQVLAAFFGELSSCGRLVHYNGTGFDIPYLQDCTSQYHLPWTFEGVESVDLFRTARRLKKLLGAPNCRLKTVEALFGLDREDEKTGGELIADYLEWQNSRDPRLQRDLLLHNCEDVANLPRLESALAAFDGLADRPWEVSFRQEEDALAVTLTDPGVLFPCEVSAAAEPAEIRLAGHEIRLRFPLSYGEHRHFYEDYRRYDYIPDEDRAMLRTLAQYLDPSRRRRATASTCYTRHSGLFVAEPGACLEPDFRDEYRSAVHYALFDPARFTAEDARALALAALRKL